MQRSIVALAFTILSSAISGQDRPLPEPEYLGVYYLYDSSSNKLVDLERQKANPAAKAKALGFGGVKSALEIPGVRSTVRFPADQKLVFVFKAAPGLDPQTLAQIVKLTAKKDHREILQMQSKGVLGMGGIKTESDSGSVFFNVSKYSETSILVSPADPLAPGEYAIRSPSNPSLFCFGVDPPPSH